MSQQASGARAVRAAGAARASAATLPRAPASEARALAGKAQIVTEARPGD